MAWGKMNTVGQYEISCLHMHPFYFVYAIMLIGVTLQDHSNHI